ncbi:LruC domain-containing protein [Pedobacter sp. JCM 36344]|uniref:LruC domain-containing protein n=1 Tax=Pedobacter sp. JCM 36344 TaxID=3374280 RepID=UPI0039784596
MKFSSFAAIAALLLISSINATFGQYAPSIDDAQSFAVLASSTVTNNGSTVINGNAGVSPGSAITGFLPAETISGAKFSSALSQAGTAQKDAQLHIDKLATFTIPVENDLTGKDLGSLTLKPGTYSFPSSVGITGTLTLDDGGDPNAVFVFKIGSTLTTAARSKVIMKSGGKGGPNVFWYVGSSATIGTYSTFVGNIIATASIAMMTGATTTGKLTALTGAVNIDINIALDLSKELADRDGDGIPDLMDDFPDDADKAFKSFSSLGEGSTIGFEDQWPVRGDFDINDLVITSKYTVITNAKNIVVQVIGNYMLQAAGGSIDNGFGVMFPLDRSEVVKIEGAVLEENQSKAVIILFENMHKEMANGNTEPGKPQSEAKEYTVKFDINKGPLLEDFGLEFNPFIFYKVGKSRHEVHMAGNAPTDLIDKSLFGTSDDSSDPATGRYYVTKTGLPYAIAVPASKFQYPIEGKDVTLAYLHFAEWAASGGKSFADWYDNVSKGYRNPEFIYSK